MKCPHCQADNSENAKFCRNCGQSLQTETVCPSCQHKNIPLSMFCEQCGQSLTATHSTLATVSAIPETAAGKSIPEPKSFSEGRYVVKRFLGEGGRKRVYLAHDTVLDREVAFAQIKTEKLDEDSKLRLKREAQAMGRLGDHPNIITVYDFGSEDGQPYMVLPLLAGGDVEDLIAKAPGRRIPLTQAIRIGKDICSGLSFAHSKGITHRDLKPGNVWLSEDGTAKIGDFGLAMSVDLPSLTQSGVIMGTLAYLPPEQAMGSKVTPMADLYSLGAMLYEMVAGRRPFVGEDALAIIGQHINTPPVSPSWHREDLLPGFEALIMQLLEKDPQRRPESASAVYQVLESIETGNVTDGVSEGAGGPGENPLYRRVFVGREAFMVSAAVSLMNLFHLGRSDEMVEFGNNNIASSDQLMRLSISNDQEVARILDQLVADRSDIRADDDETPAYIDGMTLQAAARVKHRPASELLLDRFAGSLVATSGLVQATCIPRHLAAAAALLGRLEEARKHYDEALRITTEMRFRPELALTRLQLAELLLEHYPKEKDAAKEHLDIAIEEFREMKMQPSLTRALKYM